MNKLTLAMIAVGLCLSASMALVQAKPQPEGAITGKDGAPMVLVPEGEFIYGYGKKKERLSLSAFYMDQYEVTTALYRKFLEETHRNVPDYWGKVRPEEDANRPVVGIDWHDARKYCGWVGKRLPTKEEWEKAARGTDGRKYPWGNEEPDRDRASYNWDGKRTWNGYSTLSPVGSYETGKSPYGIYDLVGNVSEWTSSEEGGSGTVHRGGSWSRQAYSLLPSLADRTSSANRYDDIGFRCALNAQ